MNKSVAVFRPVITTDEILGTLEALSTIPAHLMPSGARSLQSKFRVQALKIDAGIAKPAYIQHGTKPVAISNLTTDDLGGYNAEDTLSTNVATAIFSSSNQPVATGMPAELDADSEAQLLALEAAMLAEVANNGAGSENVLPERRKQPRRLEETISIADL
jgi:hypothetical protein